MISRALWYIQSHRPMMPMAFSVGPEPISVQPKPAQLKNVKLCPAYLICQLILAFYHLFGLSNTCLGKINH